PAQNAPLRPHAASMQWSSLLFPLSATFGLLDNRGLGREALVPLKEGQCEGISAYKVASGGRGARAAGARTANRAGAGEDWRRGRLQFGSSSDGRSGPEPALAFALHPGP